MKIKAYIKSMRLRTLPLSLAGVLLGSLLAVADYKVPLKVVLLVCLTTICLQVLSNLCNELGDVLHGTDTPDRLGPEYGLNSGVLTIQQMKRCIGLFVALCCLSGLAMIWVSFGTLVSLEAICLVLLGAAAILGAMKYTLGRNPYGYRGLGDLFVFIFFGIVAVTGSYFVCAHTLHSWLILLPACAIGFFSMGVLNTNNIRDMKSDAANRRTVAIRLGLKNARIYQTLLICLGWVAMLLYAALRIFDWWHFLFVLSLPLFIMHLKGIWKYEGRPLDRYLPLLVMASFIFSILAGIGFCAYLF